MRVRTLPVIGYFQARAGTGGEMKTTAYCTGACLSWFPSYPETPLGQKINKKITKTKQKQKQKNNAGTSFADWGRE